MNDCDESGKMNKMNKRKRERDKLCAAVRSVVVCGGDGDATA